jgi:TorA maturation chaperone TorD
MVGLAGGGSGAERFFQKHVGPWIGSFFADLERVGNAEFYASVGALGRTFVAIEAEALALPR